MPKTSEPGGSGWVSREVEAMLSAWKRGAEATAREAIERRPEIDDEAAIRLIFEETCLRREEGQEVSTAEVVAGHPRWGDELRALFDCDRLIRSPRGVADFPEVGEALGPFLLLAELGRGGSGRTYLASDPALADRPVVVKVIHADQDEHLALARLRHTHIVPLFSEHTFPDRELRGLCMPFLGGASLSRILDDLADVPIELRTGRLIVKMIDRNTLETPGLTPADGPFRRGLEQATFVQAMTWIVSCLADALHYAHARGLIHMDIKGSNVLITMDGEPMLLDFHLARGPMLAGEWVADRLGGTTGLMSPEQQTAMEAVGSGRPLPVAVDGRSDIFALGLLLRDALGLAVDEADCRRGPVAVARRGAVSLGLSDILRKCLATDPRDRYADAATLADDLRRELNDLPLRGVRNRSPRERWAKWRRRHPGLLAWGVVGLIVVLASGIASAASMTVYRQWVGHIRALLEDGRRSRVDGRYGEAIRSLERGLETAGACPVLFPSDLRDDLSREIRLAERGRLGEELHRLADRVRFRHAVDLPSQADGESLLRLCGAIWEQRGRILGGTGRPLDLEAERTIRTDLLELAAIRADLRVHLAPPGEMDEARRDALRFLDEAQAACGPSPAIDARRGRLGGARGRPEDPENPADPGPTSRSAWEYCERGRDELRAGRFEAAAEEFRLALESRPQDFWPNFYRGLCRFRLGKFEDAVADFQACIALSPGASICHFNRAMAYEALGRIEDARRGYTRAIELDPAFPAARLNRGILSYKEGRNPEAIADFISGLDSRPGREIGGRLHFNLALTRLAQGDRRSARADAEEAAQLGCQEAMNLRDDLRRESPPKIRHIPHHVSF